MKIGNINGTPEEIRNFLVDNGFRASDFLDLPKKIELKWITIPTSLFIVFSFILWIVNRPSSPIYVFLIIIDLSTLCWLTASIHLRFKNYFVSLLCLFFLLVIFSFCVRSIDLNGVIEKIQDKIKLSSPILN
jgi:hypothetical protein